MDSNLSPAFQRRLDAITNRDSLDFRETANDLSDLCSEVIQALAAEEDSALDGYATRNGD